MVTAQQAAATSQQADPRLLQGVFHQRRGELGMAEAFYDDVLRTHPRNVEALQLLGAMRISQRRYQDAVSLLDRAVRMQPRHAMAQRNRALALRSLGRPLEALQAIDHALRVEPGHAGALLTHAQLLMEVGRVEESGAAFERIIATDPRSGAGLCGRARLLALRGEYTAAERAYDATLAVDTDHVEAWWERGTVRANQQRHHDALADYDEALRRAPGNAEALYNKGVTLVALYRFHEAIDCFDAGSTAASGDARALNNLGFARLHVRELDAAVEAFDAALARDPQLVQAMANKAEALRRMGRWPESIDMFERAIAAGAVGGSWFEMYFYTLLLVCDWKRHAELEQFVLARVGDADAAATPLVLMGLDSDRALQQQSARKLIRQTASELHAPAAGPRISSNQRLRVAYVSANFNPHPVGYVTARLFEEHDRNDFEIIGVSLAPDDGSAIGQRIRGAMDGFHDVHGISDREAAALLRGLGLDIAVDLMGHTDQCRPQLFQLRTAPVQVNFLGYPGTSGAPWMDYLVADRFVVPPGHLDSYDEKVIWLPDCYMPGDAWQPPPDGSVPRREELGLPAGAMVFGCFNTHYKITPAMFDLWVRILRAVEGSVLWLRDGATQMRANLQREARQRGLDPARLLYAPHLATVAAHRARIGAMDLFLDTFPYTAHSTARDVLEAGVPLLTRIGDTFASRVAGSILHTAGFDELITRTAEDYVERAVALGRDIARREGLRHRLLAQLPASPLFDTRRYARSLEAAYRQMAAAAERAGRDP